MVDTGKTAEEVEQMVECMRVSADKTRLLAKAQMPIPIRDALINCADACEELADLVEYSEVMKEVVGLYRAGH